jgi:Carboxypeptidase regulatory-like domain
MTAALLSLVLALAAFQEPGRPASSTPDTSELRGRVTDKDSGLPLARVSVWVFGPDGQGQIIKATDEAGRFRFPGLAAGRYNAMAHPGQFRGTHVASGTQVITLTNAEIREIDITLPRALAINVRVVDPLGEPSSGLHVVVQSAETGQAVSSSWQQATDDHGRVRLFGLSPGRYILCADVYPLGTSGPRALDRREHLLRTCYPSATDDALAEPIRIDRADAGELEIRMRRGRTFTVAGRVLDASGAPAVSANVNLAQHYMNGGTSRSLTIDADGRFAAADVHPGVYAIEASVGGPARPEDRRPLEAGFVAVGVESADVDDLVVLMKKGVDVPGRFTLEDPSLQLPPLPGSGLLISARLAEDRLPGSASTQYTTARADRSFTLAGMSGRRILQIRNVPRGWYVKSIRYGTREIIDDPAEFKDASDPLSLDVVLSNRGAVVIGRVIDDRGNPVRATVFMFRTRGTGTPATLAATATSSAAGTFRLGPARGGDYAIMAVAATTSDLQPWEWDRTARLAALGERLTLGELDERTVELRFVAPDRR